MGVENKMLFLLLAVSIVSCLAQTSKVVKLSQGAVKGYRNSEYPVFEFHGIPYATEPKGRNKYGEPLPAPIWMDTLEAVEEHIACKQAKLPRVDFQYAKVENCLVANVYVPDTQVKKLPVLVIIHGGGHQIGYGNLAKPISLVSQGKFIAVTFNFRLGVNGFLCLGTKNAPGNAAFKDQVALLKWVKKNIESFGGDPNDVTLSGYSAGSASVEFHILSEKSKGLFHKAIPESGSALSPWSIQIDPVETAVNFAKRFGYKGNSLTELEEFYLSAGDEQIFSDAFFANENSTFGFVPCVEKKIGGKAFISKAPSELLKSGQFTKVPELVGFANKEGKLRWAEYESWKDIMEDNFALFLPQDLKFDSPAKKVEVANQIKEFYFKGTSVQDNINAYVDYFSDVMFTRSVLASVKDMVKAGNEDIYLYEFSYVPDVDFPSFTLTKKVKGADHCGQTFSLYDVPNMGPPKSLFTDEQIEQLESIRQIWINFIKTGKPVPENSTKYPKWPQVSKDLNPHMSIGEDFELRKGLIPERFAMWQAIYAKYYNTPKSPPESVHTEL